MIRLAFLSEYLSYDAGISGSPPTYCVYVSTVYQHPSNSRKFTSTSPTILVLHVKCVQALSWIRDRRKKTKKNWWSDTWKKTSFWSLFLSSLEQPHNSRFNYRIKKVKTLLLAMTCQLNNGFQSTTVTSFQSASYWICIKSVHKI